MSRLMVPPGAVRVYCASHMVQCPGGCDEPYCEKCETHYADCACLGPDQAIEAGMDLVNVDGVLWAVRCSETAQ